MTDLLVAGHITLDKVYYRGRKRGDWAPGGPPTYSSIAAASLHGSVAIVSKVGEDFPRHRLAWLESKGVALEGLRIVSQSTTRFVLSYTKGERSLRLLSRCEPISIDDLRDAPESRIVHLAPVAGELNRNVSTALLEKGEISSIDPQGYCRKIGEHGIIGSKRWFDRQLLRRVHIFKSSLAEARSVTGRSDARRALIKISEAGPDIAIVTMGPKGSLMYMADRGFYRIPAFSDVTVRDPTGAGDVFAGAFLISYLKDRDPIWSACVGSAFASVKVEKIGPTKAWSMRELFRRAHWIYQRSIRLGSVAHSGFRNLPLKVAMPDFVDLR